MSDNRNDESTVVIFALCAIGVGFMVLAAFVFALLAFAAFVYTIICLCAWNEPLRHGKHTLTTDEARSFVLRGCFGLFAVPLFVGFCSILFDVPVDWNYLPHLMVLGYTLGSVGIEIMMASEQSQSSGVEIIPPQHQLPAPPPPAPERQRLPFRFASWDDEEARR